MIVTIVIILTLAYVLLGTILVTRLQTPEHAHDWTPEVSVVLAVKDEIDHLQACLDSLLQLDYPRHKLDIILVNDGSTDGSAELLKATADRHAHISLVEITSKSKPGKAGAILQGIAASRGDIICLTDADCRVPQTWVRRLVRQFDDSTGLVGGFTVLNDPDDNTPLFGRIQSCDWLYLLSVASATAAMGQPISWVGNNLAVRRAAYDEIGGFEALNDTLVEDFALLKAIDRRTSWRIRIYPHRDSLVISTPAKTVREFYDQRKRWASGIFETRFFGLIIMTTGFLTHAALVLATPFHLQQVWQFWLFLFAVDWTLLRRTAALLDRRDIPRVFFPFEILFFFYTVFLPVFMIFDRKIHWKGNAYRTGPGNATE